jgi:hypothetical protein
VLHNVCPGGQELGGGEVEEELITLLNTRIPTIKSNINPYFSERSLVRICPILFSIKELKHYHSIIPART